MKRHNQTTNDDGDCHFVTSCVDDVRRFILKNHLKDTNDFRNLCRAFYMPHAYDALNPLKAYYALKIRKYDQQVMMDELISYIDLYTTRVTFYDVLPGYMRAIKTLDKYDRMHLFLYSENCTYCSEIGATEIYKLCRESPCVCPNVDSSSVFLCHSCRLIMHENTVDGEVYDTEVHDSQLLENITKNNDLSCFIGLITIKIMARLIHKSGAFQSPYYLDERKKYLHRVIETYRIRRVCFQSPLEHRKPRYYYLLTDFKRAINTQEKKKMFYSVQSKVKVLELC